MDYFRQCSCLETNPCVLVFTISLTLKDAVTAAKFGTRWPSFQILRVRYGLKNLRMGYIKPILTALLFEEW